MGIDFFHGIRSMVVVPPEKDTFVISIIEITNSVYWRFAGHLTTDTAFLRRENDYLLNERNEQVRMCVAFG